MGKRLYVGNLNYRTTEDVLEEMFSEYGTVVDATIIEGKGFGFVEMESDDAAEQAKEGINGVELDGRELRIEEARPRPDRGDGGGGGGPRRDRDDRW